MDPNRPCPLLVVLSAPSGGGKTTLCQQLLSVYPNLTRAVTCTTRAPRPGEVEGVDYYFLTDAVFSQHVAADDFLENATVYGSRYGNLKSEVLGKMARGQDVLLTVDVQGAASIRRYAQVIPALRRALVTVFLTPPSLAVLEQRLARRGTDGAADRVRRLSMARDEIAQWADFDYLILSGTVAEDLQRMRAVLDAERLRPGRVTPPKLENA